MTLPVPVPREKSVDVTHLHELYEKALRTAGTVEEIVEVEMMILESDDSLEPVPGNGAPTV